VFAPPCLPLLVFDKGFQDFLHVGSCLHHGAKTCFEKAQLLGRQLQPVSQWITFGENRDNLSVPEDHRFL